MSKKARIKSIPSQSNFAWRISPGVIAIATRLNKSTVDARDVTSNIIVKDHMMGYIDTDLKGLVFEPD